MTTTQISSRPTTGTGFFSMFHSVLGTLGTRRAMCADAQTEDRPAQAADRDAADVRLSMWDDAADFRAHHRALCARMQRPARPRRKMIEVDPQSLARAERMIASIHSRSANA
jgi:hypothetical protein